MTREGARMYDGGFLNGDPGAQRTSRGRQPKKETGGGHRRPASFWERRPLGEAYALW